MKLICGRCAHPFESDVFRGYCDGCVTVFKKEREPIRHAQHPNENIFQDGKFAEARECPVSVMCPISGKNLCGLCGSEEIESGYGVGSGYGMGSYNFCCECGTFLDFHEDFE